MADLKTDLEIVADTLIDVCMDDCELNLFDAGAALSIALARVVGLAIVGRVMNLEKLDALLASLKATALAIGSNGIANDS